MKRALLLVLAAALAVAVGVLPLRGKTAPDLEVRTRPRWMAAGLITAASPLGQGFRCARDGLHRIELGGRNLRPDLQPAAELVLRADAPDGEIVRRAVAGPIVERGELPFDFEPVADSGGRTFFFEVAPAEGAVSLSFVPVVFYRGSSGPRGVGAMLDAPHEDGDAGMTGEVRLLSQLGGLSGLAVPVDLLPDDVPARVEVFLDDEDEPVRTAQARPMRVWRGHALFSFEPLSTSRRRDVRAVFTFPAGTRPMGGILAAVPLYGAREPAPRLLGATAGGVPLDDRDLGFAAWSDPVPAFAAVRQALGGRALLAGVLLVLGAGVLLLAFAGEAGPARQESR